MEGVIDKVSVYIAEIDVEPADLGTDGRSYSGIRFLDLFFAPDPRKWHGWGCFVYEDELSQALLIFYGVRGSSGRNPASIFTP